MGGLAVSHVAGVWRWVWARGSGGVGWGVLQGLEIDEEKMEEAKKERDRLDLGCPSSEYLGLISFRVD